MITNILYIVATLILIAYAIVILDVVAWIIDKLTEKVLQKAAKSKKLENDIASKLYFLKDMAPSVSSVSIIALFVVTDASKIKLIALFFFGYMMKMVARRLINAFYAALDERRKDE